MDMQEKFPVWKAITCGDLLTAKQTPHHVVGALCCQEQCARGDYCKYIMHATLPNAIWVRHLLCTPLALTPPTRVYK